ncbi:uncharacterized protein LOC117964386 [Acipenser ruthenus]|uniref:uncharacterized protein LOC117964386 n=1 Tax=Acipenser ruthenus TaxID=7906 RepID=UPI0027416225|nr:uncharacterized protein LOC117964386 [Acipenser ruthenus]XP_058860550.1 uncharacterized protein LOC117964386 [Acipenser ruthenus]
MNGAVIPHTPLAVDFWQLRKCSQARLFFLSHMHADHTSGLTSTWSNRPIYCSPVTAKLLRLKLQVKDRWIRPLEVGHAHLLPLDEVGKETMTVTLIDANHCPGSVMFLFEGYFGTILYTGDFRYTPLMLREPCLSKHKQIDVLYLDNTNASRDRVLPSRSQATQWIKELIRQHPEHNIVIGLYKLGKESLLVELALEFQSWVVVSPERMETMRVLGLPDVFVTEEGAGRFRVVEQREVKHSALIQWNTQHPTLAILPTSRPLTPWHCNLHVVPYSDHSSFQELEEFVRALEPSSVIPIVGSSVCNFSAYLSHREQRGPVEVPESVQLYMKKDPDPPAKHVPGPPRHGPPIPRGVVFESPEHNPRPNQRQGEDRKTEPPLDELEPQVRKTGPPLDEQEPQDRKTGPPLDELEPQVRKTGPPLDEQEPRDRKTGPPLDELEPQDRKTGPPLDELEPQDRKTGPPLDEQEPQVRKTGPPLDEQEPQRKDPDFPIKVLGDCSRAATQVAVRRGKKLPRSLAFCGGNRKQMKLDDVWYKTGLGSSKQASGNTLEDNPTLKSSCELFTPPKRQNGSKAEDKDDGGLQEPSRRDPGCLAEDLECRAWQGVSQRSWRAENESVWPVGNGALMRESGAESAWLSKNTEAENCLQHTRDAVPVDRAGSTCLSEQAGSPSFPESAGFTTGAPARAARCKALAATSSHLAGKCRLAPLNKVGHKGLYEGASLVRAASCKALAATSSHLAGKCRLAPLNKVGHKGLYEGASPVRAASCKALAVTSSHLAEKYRLSPFNRAQQRNPTFDELVERCTGRSQRS